MRLMKKSYYYMKATGLKKLIRPKVYFSSQKIMKKIHLLKSIGNITDWNTGILRMLSIPMVDMANLRI